MKLYELSAALDAIFRECEDGELPPDAETRLTDLQMAFETKAENILLYRQELLADASAVKEEAERLKARADVATRKAEWLRGYLLREMQRTGIVKVSTPRIGAMVVLGPPKAELTGDSIPVIYRKVKTVEEFDKTKCTDDFKAGKELPEGVTVTRHPFLKVS